MSIIIWECSMLDLGRALVFRHRDCLVISIFRAAHILFGHVFYRLYWLDPGHCAVLAIPHSWQSSLRLGFEVSGRVQGITDRDPEIPCAWEWAKVEKAQSYVFQWVTCGSSLKVVVAALQACPVSFSNVCSRRSTYGLDTLRFNLHCWKRTFAHWTSSRLGPRHKSEKEA